MKRSANLHRWPRGHFSCTGVGSIYFIRALGLPYRPLIGGGQQRISGETDLDMDLDLDLDLDMHETLRLEKLLSPCKAGGRNAGTAGRGIVQTSITISLRAANY